MFLDVFSDNSFETNCWMLGTEGTDEAVVVDPGFSLQLDAAEVRATFEVPIEFLFDAHNHHSRLRRIGDEEIPVYDIPYGGHHIWGATAGMLMTLYHLVTGGSR